MASTVAAEYAETKKNCMMKMSSMEEECMIERRRCATLKEISSILQNEQTSRYNKEVFKKLFQEEVFRKHFFDSLFLFTSIFTYRDIFLLIQKNRISFFIIIFIENFECN